MISDSENNTMKEQINNLSLKVSNPFIRFKYWVKEEIIDLHALLEAISHKHSLESKKQKLENKVKSANSDLEKIDIWKENIKINLQITKWKTNYDHKSHYICCSGWKGYWGLYKANKNRYYLSSSEGYSDL